MNSRKITERIKMYEADGWTVDLDKMELRRDGETRGIAPEGYYDGWYPLPAIDRTLTPPIDKHQDQINRAIAVNKSIAQGARYNSIPCGDCPSAWLDYEGNERNKRLYSEALRQVRKEIANGKQLYIRDGRKFKKI